MPAGVANTNESVILGEHTNNGKVFALVASRAVLKDGCKGSREAVSMRSDFPALVVYLGEVVDDEVVGMALVEADFWVVVDFEGDVLEGRVEGGGGVFEEGGDVRDEGGGPDGNGAESGEEERVDEHG